MTTYAEIWQSLSAVDCSKHIEKKGNLSYLSWAWAWSELMDKYPQAVYTIHEEQAAADGSVECRVSVQIDECERMMWLPVMDHKNNAISNPDKRKISDTRMRCLVKCLAMFGLGHYIYAGEDLPQSEPTVLKGSDLPAPRFSDEEKKWFYHAVETADALSLYEFRKAAGDDVYATLYNSFAAGKKVSKKKEVDKLEADSVEILQAMVDEISTALGNGDPYAIQVMQEAAGVGRHVKSYVWGKLTPEQQAALTAMKEQAA